MPPKNDEALPETRPTVSHDEPTVLDEKPDLHGETREVAAASVALAAAIAEQKPSLFSKNMLKLWWIMGIGYLISTMNGFGTRP
jgi:hypothetical protein